MIRFCRHCVLYLFFFHRYLPHDLCGREYPDAGRAGKFSLRLKGLGVFENPCQTILWAGVESCEELRKLQVLVDLALERGLGLKPSAAPYVPHITLGRAQGISRAARKCVTMYSAGVNCEIPVTSFILFRSVLLSGGVVYFPEKIYPLG